MNIAVIGAGNVGKAINTILASNQAEPDHHIDGFVKLER